MLPASVAAHRRAGELHKSRTILSGCRLLQTTAASVWSSQTGFVGTSTGTLLTHCSAVTLMDAAPGSASTRRSPTTSLPTLQLGADTSLETPGWTSKHPVEEICVGLYCGAVPCARLSSRHGGQAVLRSAEAQSTVFMCNAANRASSDELSSLYCYTSCGNRVRLRRSRTS